jgi:hypothetical protein
MGESEIVKKTRGMAGRFKGNSYRLDADISYDQWLHSGGVLQEMHANVNWWIGDWLLYGESHFTENYSQAIQLTGKSDVTIRNCAWVANVFPPDERTWDLSYTHYLEVAGVRDENDRCWLLDKAVANDLSALQLRAFRSEEIKKKPVVPPPQALDLISDELKAAVESFTVHLTDCPVSGDTTEMTIQFPWGHLEMRFVRKSDA